VVSIGALAMIALAGNMMSAENTNPRFGRWKIKSTAPAPQSNIMTYAPYGKHGMKITVDAVNKDGKATSWSYITNFDGKDEPVTGTPGTDATSVRVISPAVNEIINKKDGKITQILTNVLSPDHDTIGVIYMRQSPEGKTTNVTFATYERIQ
jgi:hypothetical protein